MDMSKTSSKGSSAWSRDDVVLLMCSLNFHIEQIRHEIEKDQKKGVTFATELLSAAVGNGCTPARVKDKIKNLWKGWGDPEGSNQPWNVYKYGVFTRTLPGVERPYPGILDEVASKVKDMQRNASTRADKPLPSLDTVRRSQRTKIRNDYDDPIACRCGFTHEMLCVHCEGCPTWQHAYCYYDTEEEVSLPEFHWCDDCSGEKSGNRREESLDEAFARLQIQFEENDNQLLLRTRRRAVVTTAFAGVEKVAAALGPFGLPGDEDVMWGPEDSEVTQTMELIASQVRRVATSIASADLKSPNFPITINGDNVDLADLIKQSYGSSFEETIVSVLSEAGTSFVNQVRMLKALFATAIKSWVFHPRVPKPDTLDAIVLDSYCSNILVRNGSQVLKSLHQAAWLAITGDSCERLNTILVHEAELLAHRLITTLLPLITAHLPSPSLTIEDWVASSRDGPSRYKIIVQIFTACLKLKARLPLTEHCYELYAPAAGAQSNAETMVNGSGEEVEVGHTVQLCIMPAVIEYEATEFYGTAPGIKILFGEHNFVQATEEQRAKGRLVTPAMVILS